MGLVALSNHLWNVSPPATTDTAVPPYSTVMLSH